MSQYLFLLLVLACPLMMVFMMRGMHGGHGHTSSQPSASLDELRAQRDQLDRRIEERETEEQTPVGSGVR
jgi:hypothetical protein